MVEAIKMLEKIIEEVKLLNEKNATFGLPSAIYEKTEELYSLLFS